MAIVRARLEMHKRLIGVRRSLPRTPRRLLRGCVSAGLVIWLCGCSHSASRFALVGVFGDARANGGHQRAIYGNPRGTAVNQRSHDIYLLDSGDRVLRFDQNGHFLAAWGWGVGDGAMRYERCGPRGESDQPACKGRGDGLAWRGEGVAEIFFGEGLAINQSNGDVYVQSGQRRSGVIQVFTADGEYLSAFGDRGPQRSQLERPYGHDSMTVTRSGRVYLLERDGKLGPRVAVFSMREAGEPTSYRYAGELFGPQAGSYAVEATHSLATMRATSTSAAKACCISLNREASLTPRVKSHSRFHSKPPL